MNSIRRLGAVPRFRNITKCDSIDPFPVESTTARGGWNSHFYQGEEGLADQQLLMKWFSLFIAELLLPTALIPWIK